MPSDLQFCFVPPLPVSFMENNSVFGGRDLENELSEARYWVGEAESGGAYTQVGASVDEDRKCEE